MTDNATSTTAQNTHGAARWPPWRLRNGISNASVGALERSESSCERWAIAGGLIVVFGLLVEVAIAAYNPKYGSCIERFGPVVADTLVALGVGLEVFFGAILGPRRGTELRGRSNAELGKANDRLAIAETVAAEARERTAEIERLYGWRRISPEQHDTLVASLRPIEQDVETIFDVLVEYERGDPEATSLARQLVTAFVAAGFGRLRAGPNSFLNDAFGIFIAATSPPIDPVVFHHAFAEVGLVSVMGQMDLSTHLPRNVPAPNLYIFVAPKPPPLPPGFPPPPTITIPITVNAATSSTPSENS